MHRYARGRNAFSVQKVVKYILTKIGKCAWKTSEDGTWEQGQGAHPLPAGWPRPALLRLAGEVWDPGGVPSQPTDVSIPSGTPGVELQAQLFPAFSLALLLGTEEVFGLGEGGEENVWVSWVLTSPSSTRFAYRFFPHVVAPLILHLVCAADQGEHLPVTVELLPQLASCRCLTVDTHVCRDVLRVRHWRETPKIRGSSVWQKGRLRNGEDTKPVEQFCLELAGTLMNVACGQLPHVGWGWCGLVEA